MRVTYPRRLLDQFKREAKRIFPKEAYAVLLGKRNGDSVRVTHFYIPDNQERLSTERDVPYANAWLQEARLMAIQEGLDTLGDLHSHPATSEWEQDTAPSAQDWDRSLQIKSAIHGICSIRRYPSGRMIARTRFWPTHQSVTERILD